MAQGRSGDDANRSGSQVMIGFRPPCRSRGNEMLHRREAAFHARPDQIMIDLAHDHSSG
jgi:hypothetical protein